MLTHSQVIELFIPICEEVKKIYRDHSHCPKLPLHCIALLIYITQHPYWLKDIISYWHAYIIICSLFIFFSIGVLKFTIMYKGGKVLIVLWEFWKSRDLLIWCMQSGSGSNSVLLCTVLSFWWVFSITHGCPTSFIQVAHINQQFWWSIMFLLLDSKSMLLFLVPSFFFFFFQASKALHVQLQLMLLCRVHIR